MLHCIKAMALKTKDIQWKRMIRKKPVCVK